MFSRFSTKLMITFIMSISVIFLSGAGHLWANSVDVTNLSYSDDSGRYISYDFSAAMVTDNTIQLPESAISRGTGETGTAYFWGKATGLPAFTLTLDSANYKATISPVDTEGVAALYAGGELPAQTSATSWFYTLDLGNFNIDMTADKAYRFDIGLGRDDSVPPPFNNASISIIWVKGYYDGVIYNNATLIIQASVDQGETDLWESTPIIRTGLDPATTTLMLDLSVDSGNHFFAAVGINDEGMTNLDEQGYTLTTEQGAFQRLPDLFPFIYMEEESASTEPQASVYTVHWQRDGGPYEVGFEVRDPLYSASAVRVTNSTYLGDGIDLNWDVANKSWHSSQTYRLGFTQVTDPYPSFTFTLTPQTGGLAIADQIKSVTGYVTEFATNLSPSGDVSSNPLFTWTGITGASGYGIELDNQSGERIWNLYGIPVNQTNAYSVPYTGLTLTNGMTYTYNITSGIEGEDSWNSSINQGSFTYTGTGGGTGGVNLLLVATGHPPVGFNFITGQVASAMDDPAVNFEITGFDGNEAPYSAYGWLSAGVTVQDMGLMTPDAFDLLTSAPATGFLPTDPLLLTEGHAYAFMLGDGTTGAIVVRSVTVDGSTVTMAFDYKYFGSGGGTIAYNGKVMTAPNWPGTDGMLPVNGATVNAVNETGVFTSAATVTDGSFSVTGIPAFSRFRLTIPPVTGPSVSSKWMNWNADINALLPFVLFTTTQYASFGNTDGTGMILGRVALESSPTTFLSGATITAQEFTPGTPPVLGAIYPVTYTSGTATQDDGIYMVKNVPDGKLVQVTATLDGYTFKFNNAVLSVGAGTVSEESFLAVSETLHADMLYMRRADGYRLEMMLEGDVTDITSVTVDGPLNSGITGFSLLNKETDEFWGVYPSDISAITTGFPENYSGNYTFSATSGTGTETFTFDFQPGTPMSLPVNIIVNESTGILTWDAVTGAVGYYVIIWDSQSQEAYNGEDAPAIPNTSFPLFDFMGQHSAPAGTYTIKVVAVDGLYGLLGNEAYSNEVGFTYTGGASTTETLFFNEAAFVSAIPGKTLINFNELDTSAGKMTFSGNEYAGQGITFVSPNSQDLWVAPPPEYNWEWSSNYLSPGALPFEGGDSNGDSLTLTFSTSVYAAGFTFLDMPNTGNVTIRAYDGSDNLIHETLNGEGLIESGDQSGSAFWGIFSAATPIARIEIIDQPDNGDDIGYDNFYFSTSNEICSYELSPASASLSAAGGSGTIAVTTGTGCYWTAVSRSAWLHVTAGASGTGSNEVSYSVDANYGAARTGTIMVGGKTFTVTQEAAATHTDAPTIQARFEAAMAQFNANNFSETDGFASYVSGNFLEWGMDKAAFIAEAQEDYDESVPMTWTIDSILGTGDHAAINLTWGDGQKDTLYFIKADGVWLLFGNQYLFDFWAGSGHHMYSVNTHPYWVSLDVEDPDESSGLVITCVNVTGPGITGGISLYHDEQSGIWHSWSSDPFFYDDLSPKWETQPAVPLEYTFTISYTGGAGASPAIQTCLINSFVNVAPSQASISPAADEVATRPLVFSWDSAGAGYRYKVEINDVNFNRIWDSDDLTGTTLTYNGPPLGGGQYIFSLITEDGYESMSMVNTPFQLPLLYPRVAVTTGSGTDNHPAWSPDGSKIAFTSDRSGTNNIWVINRDGSGLKQLTTFTGYQSASYPSFSPDGTKIAFILRDTDPTIFGFGVHSLYTMNPDGTVQTIMPLPPGTGQDEAFDSWINEIIFTEWLDNDRIMFVSLGPDGGSMKFYKYTISLEEVVQVVPSPEEANDFGEIYKISWNDTLGRLAFDRWPIGIQTMADTGVNYEILDIPRVGGEMDTPAQPGWRPNGAQLAFVKDYYSISNLAIFDTESKTAIVENTATDDEWPVWSPDGNAIAFVSDGKICLMIVTPVAKGDLNNDESVDLTDAILALKNLAGLGSTGIRPYYPTSGADVNGDGRAGFAEIFYILQNIAGL